MTAPAMRHDSYLRGTMALRCLTDPDGPTAQGIRRFADRDARATGTPCRVFCNGELFYTATPPAAVAGPAHEAT